MALATSYSPKTKTYSNIAAFQVNQIHSFKRGLRVPDRFMRE